MFITIRSLAILLIDGIGIGLANLFLISVLNSKLNVQFIIATFCLIITANAVSGFTVNYGDIQVLEKCKIYFYQMFFLFAHFSFKFIKDYPYPTFSTF